MIYMIGKKNITEWIKLIQKRDSRLISRLESIYAQDRAVLDERLNTFLKVAGEFRLCFGEDKEVGFVRAPGRLNTLGMHVDHRGGFVNPIALSKEIVLCYAKRSDDRIQVRNLDRAYGWRRFNITAELPSPRTTTVKDWLGWTGEQADKRKGDGISQDWINKLKAIPVHLQTIYSDKHLSGFDGVMESTIPARLGLSSSSAIVVATMEAMIDINDISITDDQFTNYCGISEWFVGTRGGSGDHAAIKFGRSGMITHMKTLPRLEIKSYLPFPEGYRMIIFDSGIEADKTGISRQKFNEKTATYEIGEIYIRGYVKTHHGSIFQRIAAARDYLGVEEKKFYLADVVECLSRSEIYELLQSLPGNIDRQELLKKFPQDKNLLEEQFATHLEPEGGYRLRSVVTYGLAESERSRMLEEVASKSRIELFGQLMNLSHDGDRVLFQSPERKKKKGALDTKQDLYLQPGGYDCSIPEIDEMVDLALKAGARGARISGAGLGGSIMVLVKTEKVNCVVETLRTQYYQPRRRKENFITAYPVQGAGIL